MFVWFRAESKVEENLCLIACERTGRLKFAWVLHWEGIVAA